MCVYVFIYIYVYVYYVYMYMYESRIFSLRELLLIVGLIVGRLDLYR